MADTSSSGQQLQPHQPPQQPPYQPLVQPHQQYNQGPPPPQVAFQSQPQPYQYQTENVESYQMRNGILHKYPSYSFPTTCPHCNNYVTTSITYENGTFMWNIVTIILLFGCCCGCCLIPLCMDDCKDVIHHCPSCRKHIGTHKISGYDK